MSIKKMSNAYSQTIDHILVALSDVKSDVEKTIIDLIKQNSELVEENRKLKHALEERHNDVIRALDGQWSLVP